MSAEDEARRRELSANAVLLAAEVSRLSARLTEQNEHIGELTEQNEQLNQRARRHSAWIWATVAGLVLSFAAIGQGTLQRDQIEENVAQIAAAQEQAARAIRGQCGFLAFLIGTYRPESRPPDGRTEYEAAFSSMRAQYADLRCDPEAIVPPMTNPAPPAPPR